MATPTLLCPRCREGHVTLGGPLLRTFKAIQDLSNPTVPEIVRHLREGVHPTAINRRVERLMQLKLVRRKSIPHDGIRYSPV